MPVTFTMLGLNAAVFLFQFYVLPQHARDPQQLYEFVDRYALSVEGLRAGHWWQLLTYQFMHGSWLHIFANSWAIFMFGEAVEMTLGSWRMLGLYLLSGGVGGLVQVFGMWAWPGLFGDGPIVGASAAAYGLIAAFVALFPGQRLLILLFFVIPISMRARTMLRLSVAFSIVGILYPLLQPWIQRHLNLGHYLDSAFMNIGHAAHLGGMAAGFLLALWFRRRLRMRPVVVVDPKSSLKVTTAAD